MTDAGWSVCWFFGHVFRNGECLHLGEHGHFFGERMRSRLFYFTIHRHLQSVLYGRVILASVLVVLSHAEEDKIVH